MVVLVGGGASSDGDGSKSLKTANSSTKNTNKKEMQQQQIDALLLLLPIFVLVFSLDQKNIKGKSENVPFSRVETARRGWTKFSASSPSLLLSPWLESAVIQAASATAAEVTGSDCICTHTRTSSSSLERQCLLFFFLLLDDLLLFARKKREGESNWICCLFDWLTVCLSVLKPSS